MDKSINNMGRDELIEELEKLGLSSKGNKKSLKSRLKKYYDENASGLNKSANNETPNKEKSNENQSGHEDGKNGEHANDLSGGDDAVKEALRQRDIELKRLREELRAKKESQKQAYAKKQLEEKDCELKRLREELERCDAEAPHLNPNAVAWIPQSSTQRNSVSETNANGAHDDVNAMG